MRMRFWRRKARRAAPETSQAPKEPDQAAPVLSDEVPAEICTAIDNTSIFERDGPDGGAQIIVMMPGFGSFEMVSRQGVARRIGKARPDMSERACMKAAKMLSGRASESRRMRDQRPAPRRMSVEEMWLEHQIW